MRNSDVGVKRTSTLSGKNIGSNSAQTTSRATATTTTEPINPKNNDIFMDSDFKKS